MLLVLLIRGLTLPGALQGIMFYLYPEPSRLADPQVWMEAGSQIFFSYGLCTACLTVLGSYNKYNNNCYRDCLWLCLLNSGTSLVAGFAVFSVLGFMAHEQGAPIEEVAESGPGLAFIAYPQAVAMMPLPQMWAVCFFIMIIVLGLDTQFVAMEVFMTSVTDQFPTVLRKTGRREIFLLFFCLGCFLSQLIMVTEGGVYVFQLFDYFGYSGASLLFIAVFESLAMGWVFGDERMFDIIEDMTKTRPNFIFKLCWKYLTPLVSLVSLVCSLLQYKPLTFNRWYVYPDWAYALGWLLALSSILLVPGWALVHLLTGKGSLRERWHLLCNPDSKLPLTCKQRTKIEETSCTAVMKVLVSTEEN
ncbi:sodium- and chloride-dependent GABA transporter 2-like isoform X2 [Triplophysa dalaica]|nr:sodium- and chloride-dependent GABA transporter 2-like isoform X2 [Triplophysa dalaica]